MIEFITASHKEEVLKENLLKSKIFEKYNLIVQKGYTNICKAYNEADSSADIKVYIHHDVYLPESFESDLISGINEIEKFDKNWGVIGVAGAIWKNKRFCLGYLSDRGDKWGNSKGLPSEVDTIDELMLITKGDFIFDENIKSNHFFGADVCLQAKKQGRKNYVINAYCEHNSGLQRGSLPYEFWREREYIKEKYHYLLPIATTCTLILEEEQRPLKMPQIYYSIPWDTQKNIGEYYNRFMEMMTDNDYACFIDGDAIFTTTFFGKQLEDIIDKHPECGLFTATASRIGSKWQRSGDWESDDMKTHREIGKHISEKFYDTVEDVSDKTVQDDLMGGVLILIKKSVWDKIGRFKKDGMLGVDNDIYLKAQKAGEKVYLMKGVYLYHYYRGGKQSNNNHLK